MARFHTSVCEARQLRSEARMAALGATTTSSLMAGKVCFQEAAKPTSTADMRRIAADCDGPLPDCPVSGIAQR